MPSTQPVTPSSSADAAPSSWGSSVSSLLHLPWWREPTLESSATVSDSDMSCVSHLSASCRRESEWSLNALPVPAPARPRRTSIGTRRKPPAQPSHDSTDTRIQQPVLGPAHARWLLSMADMHNCGSANKTLRDLLTFYAMLPPTELRSVLALHTVVAALDKTSTRHRESNTRTNDGITSSASTSALCEDTHHATEPAFTKNHSEAQLTRLYSAAHPHVTRSQLAWLRATGTDHGIPVEDALARLVEFAMNELDDEAVFESVPHLAKCTADLYSDCNIFSDLY